MSTATSASATTAPTEFLRVKGETYAFRRIGGGFRRPLLCLQHFTGTLDNWDPAVTDPLGDVRMVGRGGDRQNLADRIDPVDLAMIVDERDHGLDRRSSSAIAK